MIIKLPIEIIKLEDASYHLMMEALFPNQITGHLIIDTGASKTVFDKTFVSSFVKDVGEVESDKSSGINAMITEAQVGTIPLIQFQNLKITDFQALLLDLSHVNQLYKKYSTKQVAGLIGSDFLVDYKGVIDYNKQILSLKY